MADRRIRSLLRWFGPRPAASTLTGPRAAYQGTICPAAPQLGILSGRIPPQIRERSNAYRSPLPPRRLSSCFPRRPASSRRRLDGPDHHLLPGRADPRHAARRVRRRVQDAAEGGDRDGQQRAVLGPDRPRRAATPRNGTTSASPSSAPGATSRRRRRPSATCSTRVTTASPSARTTRPTRPRRSPTSPPGRTSSPTTPTPVSPAGCASSAPTTTTPAAWPGSRSARPSRTAARSHRASAASKGERPAPPPGRDR